LKKIFVTLFILLCFGLVACGGSGDDNAEEYTTEAYVPEETTVYEPEVAEPEYIDIFEYEGIRFNNPLIGNWAGAGGLYYFEADGTAWLEHDGRIVSYVWWTVLDDSILRLRDPNLPTGAAPTRSYAVTWNADGSINLADENSSHVFDRFVAADTTESETQPETTTSAVILAANSLLGTWEWDEMPAYTYTFNEDSTGSRGGVIFGGYEYFTWTLSDDDHLDFTISNPIEGNPAEQSWQITWTTQNRITLNSRMEGIEGSFTYLRAMH